MHRFTVRSDPSGMGKCRVALVARDEQLLHGLREVLARSFQVVASLESLPLGPGVLVVGSKHLNEESVLANLGRWRDSVRPCPLLLATSSDPENLRHLARIVVDDVYFLDNGLAELPMAVDEVRNATPMGRLATSLVPAPGQGSLVAKAVVTILTHHPPLRSVQALQRILGVGPSTFNKHWRNGTGGFSISAHHLIQLRALQRFAHLAAAGRTYEAAAELTNWSTLRLRRVADKRMGSRLRDVVADPGGVESAIQLLVYQLDRARCG